MPLTSPNSLPKDLAFFLAKPPIYWLAATADVVSKDDEHMNYVWRGMVQSEDVSQSCAQMALKYFQNSSVKISIELACGVAAMALKLPVPIPALVICDSTDLPQLPDSATGSKLLLFGSQLIPEDGFMATFRKNDPACAEFVWNNICTDPAGQKGAAWDELIANSDRHHMNVIYDRQWWLFDHDKAIPSALSTAKNSVITRFANEFPDFILKINQLAEQMLKRRPNDHGINEQTKELDKQKHRLNAMDYFVRSWVEQVDDARLKGIFTDAALFTSLIASRLPSLAMHLNSRTGGKDGKSLWT